MENEILHVIKERIDKSLKSIQNIPEIAGNAADKLCSRNMIVGIVLSLLVFAKFSAFYTFMKLDSGTGILSAVSTVLVIVLFRVFRNKIIPSVVYIMISGLLMADIIYYGYYNSYISINMMNSAGMIGSIWESIGQIMQPRYLVVFADSFIILGYSILMYALSEKGVFAVRKSGRESERKKAAYVFTCSFIVFSLIINPLGSEALSFVNTQECITYHARDVLNCASEESEEKYYIATGSYEKNLNGELYGVAEGRNLIVIQLEAFQNFAINREYNGQELTPFLNSLISDGDTVYFDHYYYQTGGGNTSDAEFATNNSVLGSLSSYTYALYDENYLKGLPWLLRERGYSTAVMHGYDGEFWNRENMYPVEGFETYFDDEYYGIDEDYSGYGFVTVSDKSFYEKSVEALKTLAEPYYAFMITLSGHHPFNQLEKNKTLNLKPENENTIVGNYLNTVHYEDEALAGFFDQLKAEGLYENSIICIYGDHYGLSCEDEDINSEMSEILGEDYSLKWHFNIPLIINIPGEDVNTTVSTAGGQLDFLPTIAYLLGFKTLDTLYMGQNLLTAEEGYSAIQSFMLKGSFINDDVVFQQSRDGVFSNSAVYDIKTNNRLDDVSDYEELSLRSKQLSSMSEFYLENDVLDKVLNKGMSIKEIMEGMENSSMSEHIVKVTLEETDNHDNAARTSDGSADSSAHILERMDELYDSGNRCLMVDVAMPEIYNEIQELPENNEYRISAIKNTVKCTDLAEWMEEHDDACVIIEAETGVNSYVSKDRNDLEEDTVVQTMEYIAEIMAEDKEDGNGDTDSNAGGSHYSAEAAGKSNFVIKADNMKYYAKADGLGFENILFQPETGVYNDSDYNTFFMSYEPWAVLLTAKAGSEEYASEMEKLKEAGVSIFQTDDSGAVLISDAGAGGVGNAVYSPFRIVSNGVNPLAGTAAVILLSAILAVLSILADRATGSFTQRRRKKQKGR